MPYCENLNYYCCLHLSVFTTVSLSLSVWSQFFPATSLSASFILIIVPSDTLSSFPACCCWLSCLHKILCTTKTTCLTFWFEIRECLAGTIAVNGYIFQCTVDTTHGEFAYFAERYYCGVCRLAINTVKSQNISIVSESFFQPHLSIKL